MSPLIFFSLISQGFTLCFYSQSFLMPVARYCELTSKILLVKIFKHSRMSRNIEIKASVERPEIFLRNIQRLVGRSDSTVIKQEDTFFVCSNGRLKLRIEDGDKV